MARIADIVGAVSIAVALVGSTACSSRSGPPIDRPETPIGASWASTQNRDHPLAGRIWDARKGAFVSEQELHAAVARARLLLLGETHDNPDHHLLQARLVRVVTAAGRRPSIAFEMLDETQQPAIDAIPKGDARDPGAIRDAVDWDESGWPEFKLYRPIFEAALEAGLPIVAGNLPRARIRDAARRGAEALPVDVRARIDRQGPLPEVIRAEMRAEMNESHCGELPDSMMDPLILGQRARDAQLAHATATRATADGAILITGSGHARLDRGVPTYLSAEELQKGPVVAVELREVTADRQAVEEYLPPPGEPPRFDYVVFTPGAEREDQCAKLREHLKKMQKHPRIDEKPPAPEGGRDEGTLL